MLNLTVTSKFQGFRKKTLSLLTMFNTFIETLRKAKREAFLPYKYARLIEDGTQHQSATAKIDFIRTIINDFSEGFFLWHCRPITLFSCIHCAEYTLYMSPWSRRSTSVRTFYQKVRAILDGYSMPPRGLSESALRYEWIRKFSNPIYLSYTLLSPYR